MSLGEAFLRQKIEKIDESDKFEKIKFLMILIVKIQLNHQIKLQN